MGQAKKNKAIDEFRLYRLVRQVLRGDVDVRLERNLLLNWADFVEDRCKERLQKAQGGEELTMAKKQSAKRTELTD